MKTNLLTVITDNKAKNLYQAIVDQFGRVRTITKVSERFSYSKKAVREASYYW